MKEHSHADMHEGPEAFDRFRKAIKTIVSVPKSVVTRKRAADKPRPHRKRKPA